MALVQSYLFIENESNLWQWKASTFISRALNPSAQKKRQKGALNPVRHIELTIKKEDIFLQSTFWWV